MGSSSRCHRQGNSVAHTHAEAPIGRLPTGQVVLVKGHEEAPATDAAPAAQGAQPDAPALGLKVPAAHAVQLDAPEGALVPAEHAVQPVAPTEDCVPDAQGAQPDAPALELDVPAAHAVQLDAPRPKPDVWKGETV